MIILAFFNLLQKHLLLIIPVGNQERLVIQAGQSLKNLLEKSSPTFIKFGQLLSHRPDILPKLYTEQLLPLTDNTQALTLETIKIKIDNALCGQNLDFEIIEIFQKPLGSASIAQVHKVLIQFKDGTQRLEAWKIQKGEIKKVFERDLWWLRLITKTLDLTKLLPPIDNLAQEYQVWLKEETDFRNEANNIKIASTKNNFKPLIPTKIPLIINSPQLFGVHISTDGSDQIIRMELIEGSTLNQLRLDDSFNMEDRRDIVNQALRGFFSQFLIYGFVHTDPHISNIIWNNTSKKLYFVDFGLVRQFSSINGLHLLRMFRGFLTGNRNLCYDGLFGLMKIGVVAQQLIIPDLDRMFQQINQNHINNPALVYRETGSLFLTSLIGIIQRHKIKISTDSSAIFKAMATTDAVYTTVCPEYNIQDMLAVVIDISQLFLQKIILQDSKLVAYSLNCVDKQFKVRGSILTGIETPLGKDILSFVTQSFVIDPTIILSDTTKINEAFGAIEQLENLFIASQTKEY